MGDRKRREELYAWVYENNQWGRSPSGARYYSDSPPEVTGPYRRYVADFIREHDVRSVVDLGCGDCEVVRGIDMGDVTYVGVDIYEELIRYNREQFGGDRWTFVTADLVEDDLPSGDLCLLSMALYLMSFADAFAVLSKLSAYKWVLITDGQPDLPIAERRNIDKETGKYTPRDLYGNGFYLELEPFSLNVEVVVEYQMPSGEVLRTVLLDNTCADRRPGGR